jgi:hypothetical protein
VLKLSPDKFYAFSEKLFERQKEFFDVSVVNETRNHTYQRLAKIAGEIGVDEGEVYELLKISDKPGEDGSLNSGNGVTDAVKLQVKANRLVGVHVTPVSWAVLRSQHDCVRYLSHFPDLVLTLSQTVVFDGVVNNEISSSWTTEQWEEWLEKNVV